MRDYTKIIAWQKADHLTRLVYGLAASLPRDERYGLIQQMKRAAVSIPSNIAEGAGRSSDAEFEQFLSIASGSASELRYQIELVNGLWPSMAANQALVAVHEVKRVLWALRQASRRKRR